MSDFTGTNGPWQVGSETVGGDIRIIDPNGAMIAMTEAKTGDGYLWSPSTVAENANLIAAAPELLEALQEMVAIVKKHTYPQSDKPSSTWGRMEAAEAVIAKAIGQ